MTGESEATVWDLLQVHRSRLMQLRVENDGSALAFVSDGVELGRLSSCRGPRTSMVVRPYPGIRITVELDVELLK